jgi:AcrR family transcriptional regulator
MASNSSTTAPPLSGEGFPGSSPEGRRGLQAEKSAGTRSRILEATIDCLIELGYSRTTTVEVADRAGVSRGAMLHHYPSKAELLYATMDDLHHKRMASLRAEVAKFGEADDVVEVAVNLFWEMIKHPHYYAMQELTSAARTEEELRQTLLPLAHRFEAELFRATHELFSDYVKPGTPFEEMRDIARFFFDGLAMGRILHKDDAFAGRALGFFKRLLKDLLVEPQSIQISPTQAGSGMGRLAVAMPGEAGIDDEHRTTQDDR